jgi:hypothetical protein
VFASGLAAFSGLTRFDEQASKGKAQPIAGRFFSRERPSDNGIVAIDGAFTGPVVINETTVHKLGFASPAAAVGQALMHPIGPHTTRTDSSPIIGVVADFPRSRSVNPLLRWYFTRGQVCFTS